MYFCRFPLSEVLPVLTNFYLQRILMILFLVLIIITTTITIIETEIALKALPPKQQHSRVYQHPQHLHQNQQVHLPTNSFLQSTLTLCWKDSLITNHQARKE